MIEIVNLSNYAQPEVKEFSSRDYVTYGKKNSYFQYLIDRSRGSATNGAVINSLIDLIYGNGISATNKAMRPNEWAEFLQIFKENDVRKAVHDLKTLGQCAFQIQYKGGHKKIKSAEHIPIESLAPEKVDEDGNINGYYYAHDWTKVRSTNDVEYIPAFGKSKKGLEILYIKPYRSGLFYFSTVDYQGGLQYAELEEEIGNYHINNIQNGLAPSMLINMNNGETKKEEMKKIRDNIKDNLSGSSNAGRFILSFNPNKESEATITPVPLSDAADQYQFLSTEASQKILTAHRVVSPTLIGLPSASGFSSNAEEIETALTLTESWVAKPFRNLLLENIERVLHFNNISLDLYFESINPFKKKEVTKLSSDKFDLLDHLAEKAPEGYEEFFSEKVIDEPEDMDYESLFNNVSLTESNPTKKSDTDTSMYKVRYRYKKVHRDLGNSRSFCKKIHSLSGQKQYFRKEDINFMSFKGVNKSHGHNGQNYSIWLYKGGVNCKDVWERVIFKKILQDNGEPFKGNPLQHTEIVKRAKNLPDYPKLVRTAPIDMPNNGHHPNYRP